MSDNPYAPTTSISRAARHAPEAAGPAAFWLTMVFPVLLLWDFAASLELVQRFPMEHFWFEVGITTPVFLLSLAAVPLAIVGLRSSRRRIAAVALLVGTIDDSVIYFVKFHPWVMRSL